MAKALNKPVRTGKVVTAIHQQTSGITVHVADGSQYKADVVVSSIPLTALRQIDISPALPSKQQQAIDQFTYSKALIVHLTVSGEYWGKQTPSLWTDTTIERIFATTLDGTGKVSNITLWITGENAMRYSAMEPALREKTLLDTFKKIYPDAKGKVKIAKVVDWNKDPFSQGTWANWLPGQQSLVNVIAKPTGKLYFAGEHTAISNSGMEAAMESSERVVAEILGAQASAAQLFMACQACHSIDQGQAHKLGPNLHGFFNQPAATREAYVYSEALSNAKLSWDRQTLKQWLLNPEQLVPGTKMIYHNTYSADQINQLINYLAIEGATK
jgi:monoamine oxidase